MGIIYLTRKGNFLRSTAGNWKENLNDGKCKDAFFAVTILDNPNK